MIQITEQIWNDLSYKLEQFIRRQIPDKSYVHDLLQEVFIKIHSNIDTLKNKNNLTSWIYQITRNAIIDYLRNQRITEEITETTLSLKEEFEEEAFNKSIRLGVKEFIDKLPQNQRQAILLTEYDGMTLVLRQLINKFLNT